MEKPQESRLIEIGYVRLVMEKEANKVLIRNVRCVLETVRLELPNHSVVISKKFLRIVIDVMEVARSFQN